ncbi:DUF58 domain-containing protein [Roseibium algae]|uniref:DUF58 domain-containing protein n=1 Tax=Roseibium algae TaxID=3123038 RepID=A0ABU8TMH0_9HYPH
MSASLTSGVEVSIERLIELAAFAGLASSSSFAKSVVGSASGPKLGDGGDIYDLRPFQDGDDPRQIDPGASARSGRPQLRSRHEQVDRTALLVADFRSSMFWGTQGRLRSVAAAEALAVEGWQVVAGGGQVGCVTFRDDHFDNIAPKPREAAMLSVAGALARSHDLALQEALRANVETPTLDVILDRAIGFARPGCDIVLATGFDEPGDHFEAAARTLMRKCRLTILLVQDALEIDPPEGVFSAKLGKSLKRGRLEASTSAKELAGFGIDVRVIPAADAIDHGGLA